MSYQSETTNKNATLVFKNITFEQAKQLSSWYERLGQQHADEWFDPLDVDTPMTDCQEIDKATETVTIYCK